MRISDILRHKGRKVVTCHPDVTVAEALRRLHEERIGAMVVRTRKGNVLGLVSERDLVRALALRGADAFALPVDEVRAGPMFTCRPDDDVKSVMEMVTLRRERHVPVMQGGALTGIVSIGDLVKSLLEQGELEVNVLRDYARAH